MKKVKLSMLKSDRLRMSIPVYSNGEEISKIEIYNATEILSNKIEKAIKEQGIVDDELKLQILKDCTNIDVDTELDESFYTYYSSVFQGVMKEIEAIIFEITINFAKEVDMLANIPKEQADAINNLINKTNNKYNEIEKGIEYEHRKKEKEEIKRKISMLQNKLKE